ncbi:MAG TPA: MarC family protein [Acidimicrobiales bacterium]|nr:MarC family protein [Acidimicrobiales bacterium]
MPDITFDPTLFATAFVTVLVIMDPIGNIPIFLALTKGQDVADRRRAALLSSVVAGIVILGFALGGDQVLHLLGISLESLQVAGGLLLLVIALELLHPTGEDGTSSLASGDTNIALVPLGTPLLAGPGAIAATMLYTRQAEDLGGSLSVVAALLAVLVVIYLSMRYATVVARLLRDNGIELLSRIMGLLVAAIAVQLIAEAIETWIDNGVT